MTYVPLSPARFQIIDSPRGPALRIPAPRNIVAMIFLGVWLCGWTVGGAAAIFAFLQGGNDFLLFWLAGWALGLGLVLYTLAWMLAGAETVTVFSGDLEITRSLFGWSRSRLYRGRDISALAVDPLAGLARGSNRPGGSSGTVRFTYGGRTKSFAFGLDPAEGGQIVAWLQPRLGSAA